MTEFFSAGPLSIWSQPVQGNPWSETGGGGAPLGSRHQLTVLALSVHTFGACADHASPH